MELNDERLSKMAQGSVWRLLLSYSFPSIMMMVVGGFYNIVDAAFVGHGVGPEGLAAMAVSVPLMVIQMAIGSIAGPGAGALVAIRLGEGDREGAQRVLGCTILYAAMAGAASMLITLPFLDHWLILFGAQGEILLLAKRFSTIILAASPLLCLGYGLNPLVRNEGSPMVSLWATVTACLVNIGLNPLLIFGFKMGIAGSAWATVTSFAIGCLWNWGYYCSRRSVLKIRWREIRWHGKTMLSITQTGLSTCLMQLLTSVVLLVCNNTIYDLADDQEVAIFTVCNRLQDLIVLPAIGIYLGAQPLIGYNYGAGNYRRVLEILRKAMTMAAAISVPCCLAIEIFADHIMRLFVSDPAVIEASDRVVRTIMAMIWVVGPVITASNFFLAINKPRYTILFTTMRQGVILIPLVMLLPQFFGIDGVWLAFPAMDTMNTIIVMSFFWREVLKMKEKVKYAQ